METIQNYIKDQKKIDYPKVCELLIRQLGVNQKVSWDAILPLAQQRELFGVELLRNIVELPQRIDQHEIRAISLLKGDISQLLFFFVKLNDEELHKAEILQLARRFHRGQLVQNYIIWFVGNKAETRLKIVVVGKEGKKIKLKILPLEVGNWFKTYDLILNEVNQRFNTDGLFQNLKEPANLWKAVWESFDISIVNKHFYIGIYQYFKQIVDELTTHNQRLFNKPNSKEQFAIRLIGRIIFCWFLKKKGIVKENVLSSKATNLTVNERPDSDSDYYDRILSVLFFEVFNTPKNKRIDVPHLLRDYPYLNGGLFEPQEEDYHKVEDGKFYIHLKLGNSLFESFFRFLEGYNFTVDENSSTTSEIAIDPEMLGRIFENLLAAQNPETGETARKSTGSYYTPREIVDYMVEQSLIEYLKTNLPTSAGLGSVVTQDFIEELVHTENIPDNNLKTDELNQLKQTTYTALCKIKVLDPACGSGAFPIGMLQKIVALKNLCYSNTQPPKVEKNSNIPPVSAKLLRKGFQLIEKSENSLNYTLKLETLQNSIFGVDIQPLATELSRLRSWLTLIVEEDPKNIRPLPNLDFKFVTANTLIGIGLNEYIARNEGKLAFPEVQKLLDHIKQLQTMREQYFSTATPDGFVTKMLPDKEKLKKAFNDLQKEVYKLSLKIFDKEQTVIGNISQTIVSWKPFNDNEVAPFFDELWMFGIKDGFDIVIANPPYIQLQKNGGELAKMYEKQKFETFERTGDIYSLFYEKGVKLLNNEGILCFITSNKWMRANYGASTRHFFAEKTIPLFLIDFGNIQVFESATVDTNIIIAKNRVKNRKYENKGLFSIRLTKDFKIKEQSLAQFISSNGYYISALSHNSWVVGEKDIYDIKGYVEKQGTSLDDKYWSLNFKRGVLTGYNEAFIIPKDIKDNIIKEDENSQKFIKPILRGRDISAWYPEFDEQYLIGTFPSLNIDIEKYKGIENYLLSIGKDRLEQDGKGRKKTGNKWFETQDQIAYWQDFEKPKIIYPNMTKYLPFVYDETEHFYSNDKSFILVGNHLKYLTCFFNSKLFKYCFSDYFPELQGGTRELRKVFFDKIPVKPITDEEEVPFAKMVDYLVALKKENSTDGNDRFMFIYFEQIANALVCEWYFKTEFEKSKLKVAPYISELPQLHDKEPILHQLRRIFVIVNRQEHPVRQAVFSMLSIPQIALINNTNL